MPIQPHDELNLTPPSLQNRYHFLKQIGQGTQGKVFLAEKLDDHTQVAVKQLNIESVKNWKEYELFHREAAVLETLHIDGVVRFIEAIDCLDDNPPRSFIVQQYIQGNSLADILNSGHRFSMTTTFDIMQQILSILEDLHSHEPPVIHRDIKPSNILLQSRGGDDYKVYIIDFGAVANPQIQTGGSTVAGTFGYMPPEQLMGNPVPASDIYSLAAVAVYMFSGRSPADMPVKDFRLIFEPDVQNLPTALVDTLRLMLDPVVANRLTQYDVIQERFRRFRNADYQNDNDVKLKKLSPALFEDRLWAVSSICEPGNIDLWQYLDDKTPRDLPMPYRNVKPNAQLAPQSFLISGRNDIPINTIFLIITFAIAILVTIGYFVGFTHYDLGSMMKSRSSAGMFIPLIIAWCPFIAFCRVMSPIDIILFYRHQKNQKNETYYICEIARASSHQKEAQLRDEMPQCSDYTKLKVHFHAQEKMRDLLKYGRKTIATIIDVQYIPAAKESVTHKEVKSRRTHSGYETRLIFHDFPKFKILYKFNPPDDEKEEDLVREYITYVDPDNNYEVGSPLPILYQIYRTDDGTEHVDSMPFPVPLSDLYKYNYIADISNTNVKVAVSFQTPTPQRMNIYEGKRNEKALEEIRKKTREEYQKTHEEYRKELMNSQSETYSMFPQKGIFPKNKKFKF